MSPRNFKTLVDMKLVRHGYPDQTAPVGSYVVFDGKQATVLDAATYQAQYTPVPPPATQARNTGKRSAASNTER